MADRSVRIERLSPMRVAWVRAPGRRPEQDAWQQLGGWAKAAGLLDDPDAHPVFGFNNPGPSAGEPAYGYELSITLDAGTKPPPGVGVKDFAGGTYADPLAAPPEMMLDLYLPIRE